eukprot:jgi/Tetstr1/454932/TSEL_041793.t1
MRIAAIMKLIADEGLDTAAYSHTFDLRPSGASSEITVMVGADTATIGDARRDGDARKFVVAFKSPIVVILAVQAHHIRLAWSKIRTARSPSACDTCRRFNPAKSRRQSRCILLCMPTRSGARVLVDGAVSCCVPRPLA